MSTRIKRIKALQDMIDDHARRMSEIEREMAALRAEIELLERIQAAEDRMRETLRNFARTRRVNNR